MLKYNVYYNKEKGLSNPNKKMNLEKIETGIKFLNFLKNTNNLDKDPFIKEQKLKGLRLIRKIYEVIY